MEWERIRSYALGFPEVAERPHFGRPAFRVRDRLFLSAHLDEEPSVIAHVSPQDAAAAVAEHPERCEEVWRTHGGRQIFVGLRVRLFGPGGPAGSDLLTDVIERAWVHRAPKRLAAQRAVD
ncbi:MAG TPA: MmcQ/YjbR family DNA-binding protein [Beutenbergiaceae bacterium]|nr:MmcQ/YjbR family DNA-binding protein [Beutenbergiaceae bacterium]